MINFILYCFASPPVRKIYKDFSKKNDKEWHTTKSNPHLVYLNTEKAYSLGGNIDRFGRGDYDIWIKYGSSPQIEVIGWTNKMLLSRAIKGHRNRVEKKILKKNIDSFIEKCEQHGQGSHDVISPVGSDSIEVSINIHNDHIAISFKDETKTHIFKNKNIFRRLYLDMTRINSRKFWAEIIAQGFTEEK